MTLFTDIQEYLKKLPSKIILNGNYSDTCLIHSEDIRACMVSTVGEETGIIFQEKEYAAGRLKTSSPITIAKLMHQWLEEKESMLVMKMSVPAIEIFENFSKGSISSNQLIEKSWDDLKNFFFENEYLYSAQHFDVCLKIMQAAKNYPQLSDKFLYGSLGRICFSNREDNGYTRYLCIYPNRLEHIKENFVVNTPMDDQLYFNDLKDAFQAVLKYIGQIDEDKIELI